jgi:hypothetical protein
MVNIAIYAHDLPPLRCLDKYAHVSAKGEDNITETPADTNLLMLLCMNNPLAHVIVSRTTT